MALQIFLPWLPERQLCGTLVICINARWLLLTPVSPPDGISFNLFTSSLFSHTYNKQYVHFIKSDVTEEIL